MATKWKRTPAKKSASVKRASGSTGNKTTTPKAVVAPPKGEGERDKTPRQSPAFDKLDAYGAPKVCASITDGKSLTEIAKDVGVSFGSLSAWLEAQPERSARAREARSLAARLWDEQAFDVIDRATDSFGLAKAKEKAHHLRWRAAKIAPREYGDKLGLGGAPDLPPLPQPAGPSTEVNVTFEMQPADAYAEMLRRKG